MKKILLTVLVLTTAAFADSTDSSKSSKATWQDVEIGFEIAIAKNCY